MLKQVYRWCVTRPLVLLVDGGYAAVSLGLTCNGFVHPVILVTPLRLDAALYDLPPPPDPHRRLRWNIEVTFEQVHSHLGLETQRQWSDLAIARTTPCLLGLVSLIVLMAYEMTPAHQVPIPQAA